MSGWEDEPASAESAGWDIKEPEPSSAPQASDETTNETPYGQSSGNDYGSGGNDYGGGDFGGGGGGEGRACRRCHQEGHMAAECTEPDTRPCHNCGEVGHQSRECPQPRKPREGESCRRCGSLQHVNRDCPLKNVPKEGQGCYDCGSTTHFPRDCPMRKAPEEPADPAVLDDLWGKVKATDKTGEFDDVKAAILAYVKADRAHITWLDVEEKLRESGCRTHILAEGPRMLPPSKELADNKGDGNKKYEVVIVRNARQLKMKLKDESAIEKNKENLQDAGMIRERLRNEENRKYELPEWAMDLLTADQKNMALNNCLRCGNSEHKTKDCTEERATDDEKKKLAACFKCGNEGHSFRNCPAPNPEFACKRCQGYGHRSKECSQPDTREPMKCRRCGEEGHKSSECEAPDTRTCNNCGEPGHMRSDCPNPPKGRPCHNCGQEGHISRECQEPKVFRCRKCNQPGHRERECPGEVPADTDTGAVPMDTAYPAEQVVGGGDGGW